MAQSTSPRVVFHYAVADNGVIGKDNDMPWHVSSDLKRFKAMTMGKPLIMGRRTFESIGRPLPGRSNIVVTKDAGFQKEGILVVSSIEAALAQARTIAEADGVDEIAIIGGGSIYNALWSRAERLYVTHVHAAPEGDTFLPVIDPEVWQEVSRAPKIQNQNDSAAMTFVVYERKAAPA
nr:dihydrofolate reductase [uncultured Cohaesibacter sp.]